MAGRLPSRWMRTLLSIGTRRISTIRPRNMEQVSTLPPSSFNASPQPAKVCREILPRLARLGCIRTSVVDVQTAFPRWGKTFSGGLPVFQSRNSAEQRHENTLIAKTLAGRRRLARGLIFSASLMHLVDSSSEIGGAIALCAAVNLGGFSEFSAWVFGNRCSDMRKASHALIFNPIRSGGSDRNPAGK